MSDDESRVDNEDVKVVPREALEIIRTESELAAPTLLSGVEPKDRFALLIKASVIKTKYVRHLQQGEELCNDAILWSDLVHKSAEVCPPDVLVNDLSDYLVKRIKRLERAVRIAYDKLAIISHPDTRWENGSMQELRAVLKHEPDNRELCRAADSERGQQKG